MRVFSWIAAVLLVGLLVKKLGRPHRVPGGIALAIFWGAEGGFAGGLQGTSAGLGAVDVFNFGSLLVAFAGALIAMVAWPDAVSRVVYRLGGERMHVQAQNAWEHSDA